MDYSQKFYNYIENLLDSSIYQFALDLEGLDSAALFNIKEFVLGNGILPNVSNNTSKWTDNQMNEHYDIIKKYLRIKKGKKGSITSEQATNIRQFCYEVEVLPLSDIHIYSKEDACEMLLILHKLKSLPSGIPKQYFVYNKCENKNHLKILNEASKYFKEMYWNF